MFETADGLVEWLESNGHSRSAAEAFVKAGWAPSAVIVGGKMYDGVDSIEAMRAEEKA